MRKLGLSLSLTSAAMAVRSAFKIASVNPVLWWDAGSHRAGLAGGAATLFQDSAGATAVSAVEQPVGLVLDPRRVYGAERVVNGEFSGAAGWIESASFSVVGGGAKNNGTNSFYAPLRQLGVFVAGKTYEIRFDLSVTSGSLQLWIDGQQYVGVISASGSKRFFVSAGFSGSLFFEAAPSAVISIDNVSVKEVVGAYARQATSTARPVLTARKNLFTYSSQPENLVWGKNFGAGVTVLAGQAMGPDGQQSMARVTSSGAGGALYQSLTPASASVYTYGAYIRQGSAQSSQLAIFNTGVGTYVSVTFGWSNGVPSLIRSTGSPSNIVFEDIGGGLYRLAFTFSTLASGGHWPLYVPDASGGTGSGLVGCFQIVRGVVCGDYQRVNTATDYLVVSDAPLMLQFDGVDDALSTGTFAAGTLPSDADVYVVMRRDAGDGASLFCYQNGNTTVYCGIADSTSTAGQSSNSGTPTFAVNGAPVPGGASATRAQMAAAIPEGAGPCVLSMHNANLSSWSSFAVAGYGYGVNLKGGVGAVLITPAQPDATRAKIRKALAKAYQITGVV